VLAGATDDALRLRLCRATLRLAPLAKDAFRI